MTNDNSANNPVPNFYRASAADFKKIPGSPIAYWASEQIFQAFSQNVSLGTTNKASTGMRTGDNKRFLRFWHEIARDKLGIGFTKSAAAESRKKWFPHNKGGEFKKWYGNAELVVNWENDGFEIKKLTQQNCPELGDNLSWKITNEEKYFHHGITWGGLTSSVVSFRWSDYHEEITQECVLNLAINDDRICITKIESLNDFLDIRGHKFVKDIANNDTICRGNIGKELPKL